MERELVRLKYNAFSLVFFFMKFSLSLEHDCCLHACFVALLFVTKGQETRHGEQWW